MSTLPGTASGQAAGGQESEYTIERPFTNFGRKMSTYKKVHRPMTFGYTNAWLNYPGGTAGQDLCVTTFLGEIPWQIPCIYLNPSEFALIPPGSYVDQVRVQVVYRDRVIQFETASQATQLAVLNQKGDIAVAHALNHTGYGSDFQILQTTGSEDMVPDSLAAPSYSNLETVLYGVDQNDSTFATTYPAHQLMRHSIIQNYFCITTRKVSGVNAMWGGLPDLGKHVTMMDGKTRVNKVIASSVYTPKMGALKTPHKSYPIGLPWPTSTQTMQVPIQGELPTARAASLNIVSNTTNNPSTMSVSNVNNNQSNTDTVMPTFTNLTPIEKSQYLQSGPWGHQHPHVQPSLHVGLAPVPALNAGAASVFQFTDTRAYFDVVCEMKVVEYNPTEFPRATTANVPIGDAIIATSFGATHVPTGLTDASTARALFCGLNKSTPAT